MTRTHTHHGRRTVDEKCCRRNTSRPMARKTDVVHEDRLATRSLYRRLPSLHINTFKQASASASSSAASFVLQSVTRTHTHLAGRTVDKKCCRTHSRRPPPRRSGACAVMARRKNVVHDDRQRNPLLVSAAAQHSHQYFQTSICFRLLQAQQYLSCNLL
jgi:hypothetical protein